MAKSGKGSRNTKPRGPSRQRRLSVISLTDERVVQSIFKAIRHSTALHRELSRMVFREIARSTKLQHVILDLLWQCPQAEKDIVEELANHLQIKRKFLALANAGALARPLSVPDRAKQSRAKPGRGVKHQKVHKL